jgi:uncharacterized protein YcbX/ferredoxin
VLPSFLQSLHIYPIKSAAGISLSKSWVDDFGLSFDRRFVLSSPDGQFITARTEPKLCLIQVSLTSDGLVVTAPDMPPLTINYQDLSATMHDVVVWEDTISAQHGSPAYDQWFSQYLNKPCQLLYFGEHSERFVKNKTSQVAFADGYPLLLISQASLDELNKRLGRNAVTMAHFRPNLVVNGCDAFAEDTWQHIRIGEVEFEVTKPCSRCVFTTINPENAEKNEQLEPLTTLKSYRQVDSGDVMFGQNLVQLNKGQIKQGDKITVLNKQAAPTFIAPSHSVEKEKRKTKTIKKAVKNKKVSLSFSSWNKEVQGNTKDTILEQGENAGLLLPYSCRGGMCGRCKIKLTSGDVKQIADDGLSEEDKKNGFVLACSAIPQSDVILEKARRR